MLGIEITSFNTLPAALRLLPIVVALLAGGCGGGGAGTDGPTLAPLDAAPSVVLSGVAATGAPMSGASIKIHAADGEMVCSTLTDAAGRYSCTLSLDARGPFTVIAGVGDETLYSSTAAAVSATVNVTPLTTLIVARLSPTGDPSRMVEELRADPALVTAAKVDAKVAEVAALIAPLTAAAGDTLNPISGSFAANGTGHDKVLDSLLISIRPEGTVSNIQITLKVQPASDSDAPVELSFKSNQSAPPAPTVTIRPEDLVEDGMAGLVADFFARMKACYALPLAQRISDVPAGATSASGTATNVHALECRSLFVDDNPGSYRDNGFVVGSNSGFPGIFRESSTGVNFDRGNFEYTFANGDVFVTFRSTTTAGAIGHSTLTLRNQLGKLKAIGNQYAYDAGVRPYLLDREFPLQPAYSYLATGYNMAIVNRIDPKTGKPMFAQAVVTSPSGSKLMFKPLPGRSLLGLVRGNGTTSNTSVELFAAAYKEGGTAGNPADKDTSTVFSSTQRSDDELRAIPDQGVWTVEWSHVDTALANVKQSYRTISRTATLGEARVTKFAQVSAELKSQWLARDDVKSYSGLLFASPSAATPNTFAFESMSGGEGWTVPEGATLPTSVTVFGSAPGVSSFNDTASVATTDRKVRIACSSQSLADLHCDNATGVNQFAEGGRVWTLELYGRNLRQLEAAKQLALWRIAE